MQAAVRIEGGARPDPEPAEPRKIVPYITDEMPEMTEKRRQDANPERPAPDLNRYPRHYYDVHQIWTHPDYGVATASLRKLAEACRQHKELMFRAPDHRYDRAVPGNYRLVPSHDMRAKLAADYARMSAMIFGTPPAFADVMASIKALEKHLNEG